MVGLRCGRKGGSAWLYPANKGKCLKTPENQGKQGETDKQGETGPIETTTGLVAEAVEKVIASDTDKA